MTGFSQDLKYALRALLKRRGTTTLALITFGLGIAASTAMFSVLNAVLLRPLPYPDPQEVVSVYTKNPEFKGHPTLGDAAERGWFSLPEFRTLKDNSAGVLDGIAILSTAGAILYGDGEPERIPLGVTTPDLFSRVLRVAPIFGRTFDDQDARADNFVVVLTEGFWRRRYGADPAIVGRTIRFGDQPYTVLGVLPAEAHIAGRDVDAWILAGREENWGNHWMTLIARVADGVSPEQASARLSPILAAAVPADHAKHGVNAFVRQADETNTVKGPLWLLALAAVLLLVVACGNVAALLVGAAIDREQELAVRAALGAGRSRLVRQLLTESVLLGLGAAALGVLLASLASRALVLIAPAGVPRVTTAHVGASALLFAVGVALACSILFGLIPAINFSRTDLRRSMSLATRSSTRAGGRLQGGVVVAELALATVLLVGAGLLTRTLLALNAVNPGFASNQTLALRVSVPMSRLVTNVNDDSARIQALDAFYTRMSDEIKALLGVTGVAITSVLPLSDDRGNNDVTLEGRTEPVIAERRFISPNYFDVMGIRLVQGRAPTVEEDQPGAANVIIISDGLARLAWPGQSAIGKHVNWWGRDAVVIGVAADIRDEEVQSGTTYAYYVPRRQAGQLSGSFVIRTTGRPVTIVPALRRRIPEVNPSVAIISAQPLSELLTTQIASQRYRARLILVFAALAALFSILGIYGVTARNVAARTRELGIRMALGAQTHGVLAMILGEAVRLAVVGAVVGILISLVTTRGLEAYLWGVQRTDPLTLLLTGASLAAAAALVALGPGLRAARLDPREAIRAH